MDYTKEDPIKDGHRYEKAEWSSIDNNILNTFNAKEQLLYQQVMGAGWKTCDAVYIKRVSMWGDKIKAVNLFQLWCELCHEGYNYHGEYRFVCEAPNTCYTPKNTVVADYKPEKEYDPFK